MGDAGRVRLRLLRHRRLLPPDPGLASVVVEDDSAGQLGVRAGAAPPPPGQRRLHRHRPRPPRPPHPGCSLPPRPPKGRTMTSPNHSTDTFEQDIYDRLLVDYAPERLRDIARYLAEG